MRIYFIFCLSGGVEARAIAKHGTVHRIVPQQLFGSDVRAEAEKPASRFSITMPSMVQVSNIAVSILQSRKLVHLDKRVPLNYIGPIASISSHFLLPEASHRNPFVLN